MLVTMSKVYIIGLKKSFFEVLETLHDYGKVHLIDLADQIAAGEIPVEQMQRHARSQAQLEQLGVLNGRLAALNRNLYGPEGPVPTQPAAGASSLDTLSIARLIERTEERLAVIEPRAAELVAEVEALHAEQVGLLQYEPLLTTVEPTIHDIVGDRDLYATALLLPSRYREAVNELRDRIHQVSEGTASTVVKTLDEEMLAVIIVAPPDTAPAIRALFAEREVERIKLPEAFDDAPFDEALESIRRRIAELPDLVDRAVDALGFYAEEMRAELCALTRALLDRTQELEVITRFGETEYTFVIAGYLPTKRIPELRELLAARWGDAIDVDEVPLTPEEYDRVPVVLENSRRFRPFEAALGIWGRPVYGTVDPSVLVALSFPFIFGMIVGDAGYGLVMLALCLFFRYKYPDKKGVQTFTAVLAPAGLMSIVFGLFYFEFFGDLASHYLPGLRTIHPWQITPSFSLPFIRTEGAMRTTLLVAAIAVGVIEVVAGLIIGLVNSRRTGERKGLFEKGGILAVIFGALLLVALKFVPTLTAGLSAQAAAGITYVIYFVLGIGFIFTLMGGGIMGAVETMEAVAHIASYIRIMAVGLVGALLADAANKLVFVSMPNAAGIVIALMLHILNFAIICFSPSIHALRLTFLEFFSNFWKAGKVGYQPFVRSGKDG